MALLADRLSVLPLAALEADAAHHSGGRIHRGAAALAALAGGLPHRLTLLRRQAAPLLAVLGELDPAAVVVPLDGGDDGDVVREHDRLARLVALGPLKVEQPVASVRDGF